MKFSFLILSLAFCLFSLTNCQNTPKAVLQEDGISYFGEKIDTSNAIAFDSLPAELPAGDTMDIKVLAEIDNVCQKKGCWMNLHSSSSDQRIFVRFKDYGFFMPLNSGGKNAVVKGKLYSNVTSVDELRHYAEDEGKSQEEINSITEPKVELRMMSDGVAIF